MDNIEKILKKFFMPAIISEKFAKEDFCVFCGAPLNKGKWDKYIKKCAKELRK